MYADIIPDVDGCAVVVKEDKEKLHRAIAFVSLSGATKDAEDVRETIRTELERELPEHMQPDTIIMKDNIPLTTSGKVDYRSLEKETEKL